MSLSSRTEEMAESENGDCADGEIDPVNGDLCVCELVCSVPGEVYPGRGCGSA